MIKENKEALTRATAKIVEGYEELHRIALEEAKRGMRTLSGSIDHAEACLEMTLACAKITTAKGALNRALELADLEAQTETDTENSQERRDRLARMFERTMEIEREENFRS